MKKLVLLLFIFFSISLNAQLRNAFDSKFMFEEPIYYETETPLYFYVVESIGEEWEGGRDFSFNLHSLDSLDVNISQVNNLQDSLDLKLNTADVSSIYGNLTQLTSTEILAILSPIIGKIYYNTTLNQLVFYDGTAWQKLPTTTM